jgi:hypothetical protein
VGDGRPPGEISTEETVMKKLPLILLVVGWCSATAFAQQTQQNQGTQQTQSQQSQSQQSQQRGVANTNMEGPGEGLTFHPNGIYMGNGPDRAESYYPSGHEPGH